MIRVLTVWKQTRIFRIEILNKIFTGKFNQNSCLIYRNNNYVTGDIELAKTNKQI